MGDQVGDRANGGDQHVTQARTPIYGMTDAELESACEQSVPGLSPWAHWTSELYSLGKCLRIYACYPRFLPLYVYSDHGAGLHSWFYPHELANQSRVFLTFHPLKAKRSRALVGKQVIQVPHPWIHYRRSRGIKRLDPAKGTLVFVTHHAPGFQWENHTTEEYFASLRSLPERFHPVVLCLHMHDIRAGLHKRLRVHGFPMVTAGNTSSVMFVDHFYEIVQGYAFATSPGWGSQVAYCVELGLPYFFIGVRPRLVNVSHKEVPLGEVGFQDEFHREFEERAEALFSGVVREVSQAQREFVETVLGLTSNVSRARLSWILWREFFLHIKQWWPTWIKPIWCAARKHGVVGVVRRVRDRIHASRV